MPTKRSDFKEYRKFIPCSHIYIITQGNFEFILRFREITFGSRCHRHHLIIFIHEAKVKWFVTALFYAEYGIHLYEWHRIVNLNYLIIAYCLLWLEVN